MSAPTADDEQPGGIVFDAWLNVNPPEWAQEMSPMHQEALERLFHMRAEAVGGADVETLVRMMDDAGVDAGMMTVLPEFREDMDGAVEYMARGRDEHPGRFLISAGVDPRRGVEALRQMERWVRDYDVRLIRVIPYWIGLPPNHAVYFPVYAKAIELGVPVSVNIGMPGPRAPGLVQQPGLLDEVCLHFPELQLIGCHIGHPWVEEVVALLVRHSGFHLMTSAWAPRYYPEPIVHHAATRGVGRIMWASDYPALPIDRSLNEARELPLQGEARQRFLGGAAVDVFGAP